MLTSPASSHPRPHRRRAQPWLGTLVEVSSPMDDEASPDFNQACDAAFAVIAHVHECMSLHRHGSDLSRLSRAKAGEVVTLQSCTAEVLRLASRMEALSSGVFNAAACAPALAARGLLPAFTGNAVPSKGSLLNDLAWLSSRGADEPASVDVRVLRPICIDLGGIAKGWAVDAAVQALQDAGVCSGVVNAGGDLRVFGSQEQVVSVRHPGQAAQLIPLLSLSEGAIATTAFQRDESPRSDEAAWPRVVVVTGARPNGPFWPSVSVLADSCAVADALTKVLMIMGPDAAPVLRSCGAEGVGVDAEGGIHHV